MDLTEQRYYDVKKSFEKWIFTAILIYVMVSIGIYFWFEFLTTISVFKVFYGWFFITIHLGFIIILGADRKQKIEMSKSHFGYNTQEHNTKPFFLFGSQGYKRYRIDTGGMRRVSSNPISDKLKKIEEKQREKNCKVCSDKIGYSGGYFIEIRKIYRIFGVPVRDKYIDTETYCSSHKPKDFR